MPRPKGSKNKIPTEVKAVIAAIIAGRASKVAKLWDALANSEQTSENARAIELYCKLAEYVVPKARTEVTGEDGGPIVIEIVKYAGE